MSLLLIDNYDSFTYNIVELLRTIGVSTITIVKNDAIKLEEVDKFNRIIISPGPSLPSDSGIVLNLVQQYAPTKKILGICLGHQAIAEAFGGKLENYALPKHGCKKKIKNITEHKILKDIPQEHYVGLYHSWYVDKDFLPTEFDILAVDNDEVIMAIAHKKYNLVGMQFHPESYMTEYGKRLLQNWLSI